MEASWAVQKICVKFCTLTKSKNELPPSQRIILEKIQKSPENFKGPPQNKKGPQNIPKINSVIL
jgi:hypothetical protein